MSDRPGVANRAMPVLSALMRMAELWGYRRHNTNPCKNTRRYKTKPVERFLTAEEMARLNAVLTRDEFWCPHVVAIVRLLMLTGCRFSEIVSLEWDWIRDKRIFLPDSKSGPRTVWLSGSARGVIDAIPRYSDDCAYLFPGRPPTRLIDNIAFQWTRIRDEAGLPGLRLHDLRHSWASVAAMNGVDMVTVAKLLGHALVETTERYTHLSDQSVSDAADRVSNRTHEALAGKDAKREGATMPRVDLTARLARESKAGDKDIILFDRSLPGFGLRIHPSGCKVWIVQVRIKGRSRRVVIARYGAMRLPGPPPHPRHARPHPCGTEPRRRHPPGETDPDIPGIHCGIPPAQQAALEALRAQDRAYLPQGPHPASVRPDAARPHRPGGCGRVVRRGEPRQTRRGQPRPGDSAGDDVPGRGMGIARTRYESVSGH
jgi:site-specific recombinase XerD